MRRWSRLTRFWLGLVFTALFTVLTVGWLNASGIAQESSAPSTPPLPPLQVHPLPVSLAQWQDDTQQGNYFLQVSPTEVGYLIWSRFPVRVFVEPVDTASSEANRDRAQHWVNAVTEAVQEWNRYLPLTMVESADNADITVWRRSPTLQQSNGTLRARSAETRYTLYIERSESAPPKLVHRFTIELRPSQTTDYIRASARHELGHALGIWGHSPLQTDALYFSQVRNPPGISVRDVNTLKQIYEQPTRLGWQL
ncbi:peptidase [Oscillatoria sp. FACHB-1407]|uniref:peptidase n=1 Tax=Oscillatoria sp. FACHB-1407 TaxID=2692847 RepID=UPI001686E9C5|nr:peptidase [Oscillatoria sp. FACHB-1407]MBD2463829.1 peptidase [Oscillatoria sp. FACHB-1407]